MTGSNPRFDGAGGVIPRRLFLGDIPRSEKREVARILSLAGIETHSGTASTEDEQAQWAWHPEPGLVGLSPAPLVARPMAASRRSWPRLPGLIVTGRALTLMLDQAAAAARTRDIARGAALRRRLAKAHLNSAAPADPEQPCPKPGYVLLLANPEAKGSEIQSLTEAAQIRWPGARLVLFGLPSAVTEPFVSAPESCSLQKLLQGAKGIVTRDATVGLDAVLAGYRPVVLGRPFYAGRGLTEDILPISGRSPLSADLLAYVCFAQACLWFDPHRDSLCSAERALDLAEAQARAWRQDRFGWVVSGAYLWKRPHLQQFFGVDKRLRFVWEAEKAKDAAKSMGRKHMLWASKQQAEGAFGIEDGFLRSRGLGAALIPPLSLCLDDLGMHFDPRQASRLEVLISEGAEPCPTEVERARRLIVRLCDAGFSKYNLSGDQKQVLPKGRRILVPGQVADDASILKGSPGLTNDMLLARAREENPDAVILWKPHPDVEAGLRLGQVEAPDRWADVTLSGAPIAPLLDQVDEVWTLTSLTGFEALLRGCTVVTLGAPFYAGWGLTRDLGPVPPRRLSGPRPSLEALVYAALIRYPRYLDPVTGMACPVEVALDRLEETGGTQLYGPLTQIASRLRILSASWK